MFRLPTVSVVAGCVGGVDGTTSFDPSPVTVRASVRVTYAAG